MSPRSRAGLGAGIAVLAIGTGALAWREATTPGSDETDRQATVLADAIAYPRQDDAAGFARAALSTTLGRSGTLAILEATDTSGSESTSRLVIRIHVPEHQSMGFGDRSTPAYNACYRLEYRQPVSELVEPPDRIRCPSGATPLVPPPPPPGPTLPADTADVLTTLLGDLPAGPTEASVGRELRASLPAAVRVSAAVRGRDVAVAAGIGSGEDVDCLVAARIDGRVSEAYAPDRMQLMPGEAGCTAFIGLPD
jgi:hypothetical protein